MKLTAIIYPDSETDLLVAECPEIGTASQGHTEAEALANLQEATDLYLESFPHAVRKPAAIPTTQHHMSKFFQVVCGRFICFGIFMVTAVANLIAQSDNGSSVTIGKDFLKTNGEYVTIGSIMVKTNSPLNTDYFKQFKWREDSLMKISNSGMSNATDLVVAGSWALIKDYPKEANGYEDIMMAIEDYEYEGQTDMSRTLADKLIASSAPEQYRLWAKGFLNRLGSAGKPIDLQFKAVDGRKVDLAQMRGKVVLVDFWGTHCGPCVAELPRVKAAFEKFHAQGFEVIGISCDKDKKELEKYLEQHGISWPQYFEGKQQDDNKFTVEFGIDGIPHMFLVDRNGFLRFDNVRANDNLHPKGDATTFEDKISELLAEKID